MLAELDLQEGCAMETPEERADQFIDGLPFAARQGAAADELRRIVATAIREAVQRERTSMHDPLRLCVAAFDESLTLDTLSRPFRAVLRVCRILCLEALGEEEAPSELTDTVYDSQPGETPN